MLGASTGLFALLLHSVVDFNMHIPANAIVAVSLMALLSSHLRFATHGHWKTAASWTKGLATLILLAGTISLVAQGWCRAHEYVWLNRAGRASYASPDQIALLKKAFAIEPDNFETAYALGEAYRVESWEGNDHYAELAYQAMEWYDRSLKLNPFYAEGWMRWGMCLDWLGRHEEAGRYFARAERLDPNNNFIIAHMGWHYVQMGNYAAARSWFERSLRLESQNNLIARSYLEITKRRLVEGAAAVWPR